MALAMTRGMDAVATRAHYFTDPETGCQYVTFGSGEGLSPRIGKDGKVMCGEG